MMNSITPTVILILLAIFTNCISDAISDENDKTKPSGSSAVRFSSESNSGSHTTHNGSLTALTGTTIPRWDPSETHWRDYHIEICGSYCDPKGQLVVNFPGCEIPKCYPCDCHPLCHAFGTCCPSSSSPSPPSALSSSSSPYASSSPHSSPSSSPSSFSSPSSSSPPHTSPSSSSSSDGHATFTTMETTTTSSNSDKETRPRPRPRPRSRSTPPDFSTLSGTLSCVDPSPNDNDDKNEQRFLMVSRCPSTWDDVLGRRQCESPSGDSFADVTPHTVLESGLTFSNRHCVLCHGYGASLREKDPDPYLDLEVDDNSNSPQTVSSVYDYDHPTGNNDNTIAYPWKLDIFCKHFQTLYHIVDKFPFYQAASNKSGDLCSVSFQKPEEAYLKVCKPWGKTASVVDTCLLESPNGAHVSERRLCHDLQPALGLEVNGFKNVFCAICNGQHPEERSPCPTPESEVGEMNSGVAYPPSIHYILFGVGRPPLSPTRPDLRRCSRKGKWEDDGGVCISPECTTGKLLAEESKEECQSAIPQIQGLGYNLTLIFSIQNYSQGEDWPPSTNIDREVDGINDRIINSLKTFVSEMALVVRFSIDRDLSSSTISEDGEIAMKEYLSKIDLWAHILAPPTLPRDEFEQKMANFTQTPIESNGMQLVPTHVGYYVTALDSAPRDRFPRVEEASHLCIDSAISGYRVTPSEQQNQSKIIRHSFQSQCLNEQLWLEVSRFIDVMPSLTCPFIILNVTNEPVFDNDTVYLTFELRGQEVNVTSQDGGVSFSLIDGQVKLCLEMLNNLTESISGHYFNKKSDPVSIAVYYIEIVCICVSIASLIVAIITYCLFPTLRSLPGLNNMCLCVSLLVAQSSLLVTFLVGYRGHFPRVYCVIHAIIVHYSWLATFMWMSVCCIHMYRVFTSTGSQFSDPRSDRKRHRRYCFVAFGIPVLVVVMTTAITTGATGGDSPGYNDELCFLDTATSVWVIVFGLLVPFALSTLTNLVLFALTVREIVSVSGMAEHAGTRRSHGVIAYVKLSTLTGAFCVLAAIGVQFESPVATLLASPFAALQGLFIFLSFQANKHVISLYKSLLCPQDKKKRSPAGPFDSSRTVGRNTASSNTTTTTLA